MQNSIEGRTDQQSTVELDLSRLDSLDHLEASLLLEESTGIVDEEPSSVLQQRANRLGWAMDAATSLCGLGNGEDVEVTVTVGFTLDEVATLLFAHVVAASTYRSQSVPDTAASYERRAVHLLETLVGEVVDDV